MESHIADYYRNKKIVSAVAAEQNILDYILSLEAAEEEEEDKDESSIAVEYDSIDEYFSIPNSSPPSRPHKFRINCRNHATAPEFSNRYELLDYIAKHTVIDNGYYTFEMDIANYKVSTKFRNYHQIVKYVMANHTIIVE